MRFTKLLLGSLCQAENSDYDPVFNPNEVGAAPTFQQSFLNQHADMSFDEFEKLYPQLRVDNNWYGMGHGLEEDFRVFKRDCHNFGHCRYTQKLLGFSRSHRHMHGLLGMSPMMGARTVNDIDQSGICPDTVTGEAWDYDESTAGYVRIDGRTIILDQDVDLAGDGLIIENGGKLIFKDFGAESTDTLTLRAKSIEINGGELWIGSRSCRYQGKADIVLYGNLGDHPWKTSPGNKYMWLTTDGVLEMHGKNKHPWTQLNDHIFRDNVAAEQLVFYQNKGVNVDGTAVSNRLIFHILSAEGDLRDVAYVATGGSMSQVQTAIDDAVSIDPETVVLFTTDFHFELTNEVKNFFVNYGFSASEFDTLLGDEDSRLYSQIGGVFNQAGETSLISISPSAGVMHMGLKGTAGPIGLGGMKSGHQFSVEIDNNWKFCNGCTTMTSDVAAALANFATLGNDAFPTIFINNVKQYIKYTGPNKNEAPILTLAADVSSWEVGDQIVVGATHFDSRESETFTLVECPTCTNNQVKVDRAPTNTHWGRIDISTGTCVDQRADVGLLSRNVRFYGEMMETTCQYAKTREQTNADSPNADNNWCWYYIDVNGFDQDFHGAHIIQTQGFKNFHMSHVELFNAGQPRVGRYPIHWHHAGYVGAKGGYDDPSEIDSLSIHDAFSRFATIHGTHEATIKNCVGYNTFGHGFFLEDGFEVENHVLGNLGILVKPGIILPSERSKLVCGMTSDGVGYGNYTADDLCEGLSVFWFANLHNTVHDNSAVGGNAGYWLFTHTASNRYQYDAIPRDPVTNKREWRNNKACCTSRGFAVDESIKDTPPNSTYPEAQFSIGNQFGHRFRSMDEDTWTLQQIEDDPRPNLWQKPEGNWAKIEFNGLNMHHTNEKNWARGADMHLQGCQFSDNTRGWVHKGTAPTPGATKSVTDSIFVGYTKNTGHKLCTHDSNLDYDSRDLVTPRICSDTREGIVDLINERPQTDVLVRRIIYWYKAGNDVYRQQGFHKNYPIQGMSVYDSFIPTLVSNVTFQNYPRDEHAPRHALGTHFNHKNPLIPKSFCLNDITYINVDSYWQSAHVVSTVQFGDQYTPWGNYGDDFGTTNANTIRTLTDGEQNTGYTDVAGIWTGGQPAYIMPPTQFNVNTGCVVVLEGDQPGVHFPGLKACPITTAVGSLTMRAYDYVVDANNGIRMEITTVGTNLDEGKPMTMRTSDKSTTGFVFNNIEGYKTHKMEWKGSQPPKSMVYEINDSEFGVWYRLSLCVGKGTGITEVKPFTFNYKNNLRGQYHDLPHTVATNFDELNTATNDAYWHDSERGWLHVRIIQSEDRTAGGTVTENDTGNQYPYNGDAGWTFFNSQGIGSKWRMNMETGEHQFEIYLDESTLSGEVTCDDFEEPVVEPQTDPALVLGKCWTCSNEDSFDSCKTNGGFKECNLPTDRCQLEVRTNKDSSKLSLGCISESGCSALKKQNFGNSPFLWMSQCKPEDSSAWGARYSVSMGSSVCRSCFNTCDPDTAPAKCFGLETNFGVPRRLPADDTFWNPLTSNSRAEWETDWVQTQKSNEMSG